jgi:hypothetical protein
MDEGVIERFFCDLSARRWQSLAMVLSTEVVRIGPFGDRVVGSERYLDLLRGTVPSRYANDVHVILYAADQRAALARVTEHLYYAEQELHLEEAYAFLIGADGQLDQIEIFWQTPQFDPGGFGSATASDSFSSTSSSDPDHGEVGIPARREPR